MDKTTDNTASEVTSRTDNVNADTVNGDTPNPDTIIGNTNISVTDAVFSIVADSTFKVQGVNKVSLNKEDISSLLITNYLGDSLAEEAKDVYHL